MKSSRLTDPDGSSISSVSACAGTRAYTCEMYNPSAPVSRPHRRSAARWMRLHTSRGMDPVCRHREGLPSLGRSGGVGGPASNHPGDINATRPGRRVAGPERPAFPIAHRDCSRSTHGQALRCASSLGVARRVTLVRASAMQTCALASGTARARMDGRGSLEARGNGGNSNRVSTLVDCFSGGFMTAFIARRG